MITARFAQLFAGGRLARDLDGVFRPWKIDDQPVDATGSSLEAAVERHLDGAVPIGVYPIRPTDTGDMVHWGAIDWDIGDHDSMIHALNVSAVLHELEIPSWIELSRSKGVHLWVFIEDWMPAEQMRTAMLAACQIVDAPTTEVYPKQTTTAGGWGNGLRLPYPRVRPAGRQVMVTPTMGEYPLDEFVNTALENLGSAEALRETARHWVPPKPPEPQRPTRQRLQKSRHDSELTGLAAHIWDHGPKAVQRGDKIVYDRSQMLHAFACELFRQEYDNNSIEILVAELDNRHGGKFTHRADGARRIRDLVSHARAVYSQPQLGEMDANTQ